MSAAPPKPRDPPAGPDTTARAEPGLTALVLGFGALYLIWGSTYLAIRFAIETIPPFTMAGIRFLVAGTLLLLWARARGVPSATGPEWRASAVVGALLLLGGNGAVVWAEQWVPSGLTAVLVATVPLWMVLVDWLWAGNARPGAGAWAGIAGGLVGVWILVGDDAVQRLDGPVLLGALVVILGSLSWAFGSILSRGLSLPASPRMATALQMLSGGALLSMAGLVSGEWGRWDPAATSAGSLVALAYLIAFGGVVAYGTYVWLLRVVPAGRVATYAYVNPLVALLLGWLLADELLGGRTLAGAGVILVSVMVLGRLTPRRRRAGSGS